MGLILGMVRQLLTASNQNSVKSDHGSIEQTFVDETGPYDTEF